MSSLFRVNFKPELGVKYKVELKMYIDGEYYDISGSGFTFYKKA